VTKEYRVLQVIKETRVLQVNGGPGVQLEIKVQQENQVLKVKQEEQEILA
jgi:hypothetical protein